MALIPRVLALPLLLGVAAHTAGCESSSDHSSAPSPTPPDDHVPSVFNPPSAPPKKLEADWLTQNTVALRKRVSVPSASERLLSDRINTQLKTYDPGSLLRCEVQDDPTYRAAIDALGGVSWGYPVRFLEDESRPNIRLGPYLPVPAFATADSGGAAVEIEKADIVGMSESSALFYSAAHGLLLVDLSQSDPRFVCAAKLPGQVKDFYFYQGHLVVMASAHLLHFKVDGVSLKFIESIELDGSVLDTRRFNDRLVVYTGLSEKRDAAPTPGGGDERSGQYYAPNPHRALRVFQFGETLHEEMHETMRASMADQTYLNSGVIKPETPIGSVVHTGKSAGDVLWASDHYFVTTESVAITKLTGWQTQHYSVCTASHTEKQSYRSCSTQYETRPNPDYTPPDNSGGDRACKGVTLSDCLRAVAKAANTTIQVPVGTTCKDLEYDHWTCDAYEYGSYTYPTTNTEFETRLSIFEYTEPGFVWLDSKVREITTQGLADLSLDSRVQKLTTSTQTFDLSIPGQLQTLYFQNGFLYAIASGVLQVYSMGNGSLVRTSAQQVVGGWLQTSLFSEDKLYLSDYRYDSRGSDHSTLRVYDLSNPAFPKQASQDQELVGGHNSILPTSYGILTVGSVNNFEGVPGSALKLGLFADPFTTEKAYLILGTDLEYPQLGEDRSLFFDGTKGRMFLPYTGSERGDRSLGRARIGVSHLLPDSIASEGALHLPEAVSRVRPRRGVENQVLSFGQNSIFWLRPKSTSEWNASSLLSYYTPTSLYRISDADQYVEVLRLGSSCKVHFAKASELNKRDPASISEAFDCGSWEWAYGNNIVFSDTTGVSFDEDGSITQLTAAQIADLRNKRAQRRTCLYSSTPTNELVDFTNLPPIEDLKCYTAEEYEVILRQ